MAALVSCAILNSMNLEQKRDLYSKAVEAAELTLKGKNNLYTSHNGNMFSFVGKDGVVGVRLEKNMREEFLSHKGAKQPIQYNTLMKEYVEIDDSLLMKTSELAELLKSGFSYTDSLKKK